MHPRLDELLEKLAACVERLAAGEAGEQGLVMGRELEGLLLEARESGGERRFFRRLADGVPDGLFRLRLRDRTFEYINPAMEALTGYVRSEFCGTPGIFREVIHPRWLDYVEEALRQMDAGRNEGEYEIAVVTRGGQERRILLRTILVRKDGRPTHVEGVARDVTATRQTESMLRRHLFMTDATRDPMSLIGRDYQYKAANRAFLESVKAICRNPLGRHVSEVWSERVFSGVIKQALDECLSGREVVYEAWFGFPGQPEGYYEVTYTPYREDGAGVTHVVVVSRDLTRRKLAEEAGRRADARFRQVVESISDVIMTLGPDRELTYVSPAMIRLAGLEPEGLHGRRLEELVHAQDRQALVSSLGAILETGEASAECRILAQDGTPVWVRMAARALVENGEYLGAAGRLTNISLRKQTEEALARSERKYRDIFENIQDVYFECDFEGNILEISPAVERISFYTRQEILETGVLPLLDGPEDGERMLLELERFGHVSDQEIRFRDKDGTVRYFSVTARLVSDSESSRKVVGSLHDVTVRRAAQLEAQQAKDFVESIIDAVPDPVYVKDGAHRYVMANRAMCVLLGRGREDVVGRTTWELFDSEQAEGFAAMDDRALRSGGKVMHEEDFWDASGVWRLLATSKAVFQGRDGGRLLVGVVRDITEARRLQEELRRAKDEAEFLAESKSRFLANMSHEIRTPLNGVIGMLQLLNLTELSGEQAEYVGTALGSALGLLAVINDILDYSKIESGRMHSPRERFSMAAMLRTVERALAEQARSKGVDLEFEVSDAVPRVLNGVESRLRQVLFNLVGNAVKFTDRGSVRVRVHAFHRSDPRGDLQLYFEIEDTGIGIADDNLERIFEPFVQADEAPSRRYQGTGLGLGIVRRLVDMMHGSLCVGSELGKGTDIVFTVFAQSALPGEAVDEEEPRESAPLPVTPERSLRVLVAEDNNVNMILAERFLRKLGHDPVGVENGQLALDALEKAAAEGRPFDVVFMDIQMPVLDGVETVRRIRAGVDGIPRGLPVVALTAHAMEGDMERFLELGMDGYLAKPLDFKIFAELLNELFSGQERNLDP
ncbi:PAS domain S-box protein [Paucidesulfovibrio longus]|uniref:PAS domain S-box protein n=1 Tax=Paucidesulfovibrio longus TaxID=889 RepID=UPI0003B6A3EC|nr:PAS domain S-box protein [Paucidesulfovibrio longus]